MQYNQKTFKTVRHRPHWMQFIINEFIPLSLCLAAFTFAGMEDMPFKGFILQIAFLLVLFILYKFAYLQRLRYFVSSEQLIIQHGVFTSNNNYVELYRIVDYDERRNFIQQLVGLKTVTIYSGDRTTPHLDIIGVPVDFDLVAIIRERVEYNKQRKGVYEITNR